MTSLFRHLPREGLELWSHPLETSCQPTPHSSAELRQRFTSSDGSTMINCLRHLETIKHSQTMVVSHGFAIFHWFRPSQFQQFPYFHRTSHLLGEAISSLQRVQQDPGIVRLVTFQVLAAKPPAEPAGDYPFSARFMDQQDRQRISYSSYFSISTHLEKAAWLSLQVCSLMAHLQIIWSASMAIESGPIRSWFTHSNWWWPAIFQFVYVNILTFLTSPIQFT